MYKKSLLISILFIFSLLNTGCWNYIGLDEMTIVAGVAIDKQEDNYILNFEIYNLNETPDGEPTQSQIIEATGKTVFDAIRNAKKRIAKKLYFTEAKILIVSEKIAKEDGINSILNWFIKDLEIRETLNIIVSQEKTAGELLKVEGLTSTIVSNDLINIIDNDQLITSSTKAMPVYKAYNILNGEGLSLTLPVVHLIDNDGEKYCEVNGVAVFKKDKLVNYLSSEETKYFLIATGELKGGIIAINTKLRSNDTDSQNLSFEIISSDTSQKYTSLEENNLEIKITNDLKVSLAELKNQNQEFSNDDLTKLEEEAGKIISQRIEDIINIIQKNYNTDILGFGNIMYRNNFKFWDKIKDDFENKFKDIKVAVESKVEIYNTGTIK